MTVEFTSFKRALLDWRYMHVEDVVHGSRVWLPRAVFIINAIRNVFRELHSAAGAEEIQLPDLLRRSDVELLDTIHPISHKYFNIDENTKLAATHEAAFFSFARSYLKANPYLRSLFFYNVGKMYRPPKKTNPPFNLGERVCVLESYLLYGTPCNENLQLAMIIEIFDNIINHYLHIPNIYLTRPKSGNLPFSVKTLSYEAILPVDKTLCCGMIYSQGNNFSTRYSSLDADWHSVHSGITDYSLLSFLFSYFFDDGFDLPSAFTSIQIAVVYETTKASVREKAETIEAALRSKGVRTSINSARYTLGASKHALYCGARYAVALNENKRGCVDIIKYGKGTRENISLEEAILIDASDGDSKTIERSRSRAMARLQTCGTIGDVNEAIEAGHVARMRGNLNDIEREAIKSELRIGELIGHSSDNGGNGFFIYSKRV